MKIVHLITGLGVGGAENVVLNLAKGQVAAGHHVEVVGITTRNEMLPFFIKAGIKVHVIGVEKSIKSVFRGIRASIKLFRVFSPDIVHSHMAHAALLASCLKWFFPNTKHVFTSHNIVIGNNTITQLIRLTRFRRDADVVFSTSQICHFNRENHTYIIPNGINSQEIDETNLHASPGSAFKFVAVGRLVGEKNHIKLIEIADALRHRYAFTIDIFGDGELKEDLLVEIRKRNLQDIVFLKGLSLHIQQELKNYHAFVMPSLWEGMPITILEAGAAGLPIIATAVGSIGDFLTEDNSFVCSLDVFQDQLICVMDNYDQAVKKGQLFKNYVQRECSIEEVVEKHLALYNSLIN